MIFSNTWKASKKARKQRKYVHNAPRHVKIKFLSSPLSKELQEKHGKKHIGIRKGDGVKIVRGQFKGTNSTVEKVLVRYGKVHVKEATMEKKDGSSAFYPIHPSNIQITKLTEENTRIQNGKKTPKKTGNA